MSVLHFLWWIYDIFIHILYIFILYILWQILSRVFVSLCRDHSWFNLECFLRKIKQCLFQVRFEEMSLSPGKCKFERKYALQNASRFRELRISSLFNRWGDEPYVLDGGKVFVKTKLYLLLTLFDGPLALLPRIATTNC